ncbi:MAG: serine hydrolase domain-containing protein [Bacillota bacterium]
MQRLEGHLTRAIQQGAFPGCTYALYHRGSLAGHGALGATPAGAESLYDLASLTKPIAMLGLMALLEEGLLRLDDPAARFLPPMRRPDKQGITLRQLLTHTAGFAGVVPLYQRCRGREAMLEALYDLPLAYPPGTRVEYTSMGMIILGEVLEAVSGMRMGEYLRRRLFDPMELGSLQFNPPPALAPRCAPTEDCPRRGRVVQGEVHDGNCEALGGEHAHAGLFGTAADVAAIGAMMLQGGSWRGRRILKPSTVALMTANHTAHLGQARGLGWQGKDPAGSPAGDLFSPRSYGHTGFTGTSLFVDPDRGIAFALLTNRIHPSRANEQIAWARPIAHNMVVLDLEGD